MKFYFYESAHGSTKEILTTCLAHSNRVPMSDRMLRIQRDRAQRKCLSCVLYWDIVTYCFVSKVISLFAHNFYVVNACLLKTSLGYSFFSFFLIRFIAHMQALAFWLNAELHFMWHLKLMFLSSFDVWIWQSRWVSRI